METTTNAATATKTKWNLDASHSDLEFSVKHMMISTVKGHFTKFNIDMESEGSDFEKSNLTVTVDTDSIYAGDENRNGHLKSGDFFDVANFANATFKSTSIEKINNDGKLKVHGDLTIKDVTKPLTVDVEYTGTGVDPYGNVKAGFEFSTVINRTDFGLNWNVPLESGGLLVSQNVKIFGGLQFAKQKEA